MKIKPEIHAPKADTKSESLCMNFFSSLGKNLNGKTDVAIQWERISKFLAIARPQISTTIEICKAFECVKDEFGIEIARELYDSQAVVYPLEISIAAKYLSMGGPKQFLSELADAGFFMKDSHDGYMDVVVEGMSTGESARSAIAKAISLEQQTSGNDLQADTPFDMSAHTM